jgi:hypothetical protein
MNRRADARVDVKLPFHVGVPGSKVRVFTGVTENMSRRGVLVSWSAGTAVQLPRAGQLMTAEIELPANHCFGKKCIYCQVTVVRISAHNGNPARVAFQINQMQFRDYSSGGFPLDDLRGELSRPLM